MAFASGLAGAGATAVFTGVGGRVTPVIGTAVDNRLKLWPLSGSNALSGTVQLVDRTRVELGFASSLGSAAAQVEPGSAVDLCGFGMTFTNPISLVGAGGKGLSWALRFATGYAPPGDTNHDVLVDVLDAADFTSTGLFDAGAYDQPGGPLAAVPEPAG